MAQARDQFGVNAGRPQRVSWRRKWALRRLGGQDGGHGRPDPAGGSDRLTTDARVGLAAELAEAVARLGRDHAEWERAAAVELSRLAAVVQFERANIQAADAEMEALPEPDPLNPPRRHGEDDRPVELVAARRRRERDHPTAAARARRDKAVTVAADAERRHAEITAEVAHRRKWAEFEVHRLVAVFWQERATYDRALVRRHPLRDEIDGALDDALPWLPWPTGWTV